MRAVNLSLTELTEALPETASGAHVIDFGGLSAVIFAASAFVAAFMALMLASRTKRKRRLKETGLPAADGAMVFLVRGDRLIDANFAGHKYLETFDVSHGGLAALQQAVHSVFDEAADLLTPSTDGLRVTAVSRDGAMQAISERAGRTLRLKLSSRVAHETLTEDIHRLAAQEAELETLRETTDSAPYLVWREAPDGTPIWVNRSYLDMIVKTHGAQRASRWPLPRLFEGLTCAAPERKPLTLLEEEEVHWFDCHGVAIGKDRLFTAFSADKVVKAETQLQDFMQTLTKTFAQLTVGLAIFDRSRNLRLFNPALIELTTLQAEFLTRRPKLPDFLDRLRENRMMPEPKDYKEWRNRIAEMETAAENGSYTETWTLPGNLTYRVTGRPHPDGAIALVFEDISAEMSLTRQFRRELEMSQGLLDNMPDATAHFSRNGDMIQANKAYRELWSDHANFDQPEALLREIDVVKASRTWHAATEPTPVWGDVRDFVLDTGERAEWDARVNLLEGGALDCRFVPMADGGSQVIFRSTDDRMARRRRILEVV